MADAFEEVADLRLGRAPMNSSTGAPFLNSFTVGMLRMPNWAAIACCSSVLIFARMKRPETRRPASPVSASASAGLAPGGPEVDQHRHLVRALQHDLLVVALIDVEDER